MGYQLKGEPWKSATARPCARAGSGRIPTTGPAKPPWPTASRRAKSAAWTSLGLNIGIAAFIPGNVFSGGFRVIRYVDDRASLEQEQALLEAFRGKLGGPLADLANLVGEEVAARRAPIRFSVEKGRGSAIGEGIAADMEPYRGPTGEPTRLVESIFSTIPGSPAYVAKASRFRMEPPEIGVNLDLAGHNAIQGSFELRG